MNASMCGAVLAALLGSLAGAPAARAACQPESTWRHEHAKGEKDTHTTSVKGNRESRIEVCRVANPSGDALEVTINFEAAETTLQVGECKARDVRWVVVRTHGAAAASGEPAVAEGTAKVCRE